MFLAIKKIMHVHGITVKFFICKDIPYSASAGCTSVLKILITYTNKKVLVHKITLAGSLLSLE